MCFALIHFDGNSRRTLTEESVLMEHMVLTTEEATNNRSMKSTHIEHFFNEILRIAFFRTCEIPIGTFGRIGSYVGWYPKREREKQKPGVVLKLSSMSSNGQNQETMLRRGLAPSAHNGIPIKSHDEWKEEKKQMIIPFLWTNAIRVILVICDRLYTAHMPSNNHCSLTHMICQRINITGDYQNRYHRLPNHYLQYRIQRNDTFWTSHFPLGKLKESIQRTENRVKWIIKNEERKQFHGVDN